MPYVILSEDQQVALQRAAQSGRPARITLAPEQMKGRRVAGSLKLPLTPQQHELFNEARRAMQPYQVVIGKRQMTGGFLSALLSLGRALLPTIVGMLPSVATAAATSAVSSGVKRLIEGGPPAKQAGSGLPGIPADEQRVANHAMAVKRDRLSTMQGTLIMAREVDPRVASRPIPTASGEAPGGLVMSLPSQTLPYAGPRFQARPFEGDGTVIRLPQ